MDEPNPPGAAYQKTAAGVAEIRNGGSALPRRLRNVLLFVDGRRTEHELRELIAASGAPSDALEQLCALDLIAEACQDRGAADDSAAPGAAPPRAAPLADGDFAALYDAVNTLVGRHLGMLKAYRLQMRIERCTTTTQLRALLPEVEAALERALGAQAAGKLVAALHPPDHPAG